MSEQKPTVKLDDWSVVPSPVSGGYRPLSAGNLLVGRVSGHPRIREGSYIFTSPLVRVYTDERVAETRNTEYVLGAASEEYKVWSVKHGVAA